MLPKTIPDKLTDIVKFVTVKTLKNDKFVPDNVRDQTLITRLVKTSEVKVIK